MLTFFRRIRQSLLQTGSIKRYTVYAIGEVFLVMIGILLALQVNNWNEDRKNRAKEQYYLRALLAELEDNMVIAEGQSNYQTFQKNNAEKVLDAYMQGIYPEDPRVLIIAIDHTGWLYPVSFNKNVWNELNATGGVTLIQNDTLRSELSVLYSAFDYLTDLQREFNHFLYEYRDATASVIDPYLRKEINKKLHPRKLVEELNPLENIDETMERLTQVPKLDAFIVNVIMKTEPLIELYDRHIERMNALTIRIQSELKEI